MSDKLSSPDNSTNISSHSASGLVCEGGGMRGIYVAGVLDVLGEHHVDFDAVIGVSAGAIHASSFLAGQHGRSVRFYLAYCRDPRFMGLRSWLRTGDFVSYSFCYEEIPETLVPFDFDAMESSKSAFYITSTDVETGQPYYHRTNTIRGPEMQCLRASASLPLVSKIVEFNGHKLLDGGTSDSIPMEYLREQGYRKTVVILTQVAGYRKKPEKLRLFDLIYRRYPAYLHSIKTRHERYNATLEKIEALEKSGDIFVFRPSHKVKIKRLERDATRILDMYELGRHDALTRLDELRQFLSSPAGQPETLSDEKTE